MKKIIVFGASGDTGHYFIKYFLDHYAGDEYEVIASGTRHTDDFISLGVRYIPVDITDRSAFEALSQEDILTNRGGWSLGRDWYSFHYEIYNHLITSTNRSCEGVAA